MCVCALARARACARVTLEAGLFLYELMLTCIQVWIRVSTRACVMLEAGQYLDPLDDKDIIEALPRDAWVSPAADAYAWLPDHETHNTHSCL
eukprot:1157110-Pelagomonas_calceolata.AAC.5